MCSWRTARVCHVSVMKRKLTLRIQWVLFQWLSGIFCCYKLPPLQNITPLHTTPPPSISKMRAKTLHERGHLEWEVHAKVRTAVLVKLPERFLVSLFCRLVLFHTDISYFCKTMTKYNITGTIHWWGTISLRSHWCWEHCPQQGISIQSLNKLRPQYMRLINDNENENNKSSGTMVWS